MKLSAAFWLTKVTVARRWWRSSAGEACASSRPSATQRARARPVEPGERAQQRRLAAARRPDDGRDLADRERASTECSASMPPLGVS